jgi:hypothetical protein
MVAHDKLKTLDATIMDTKKLLLEVQLLRLSEAAAEDVITLSAAISLAISCFDEILLKGLPGSARADYRRRAGLPSKADSIHCQGHVKRIQ